jgi:hypothetical protein
MSCREGPSANYTLSRSDFAKAGALGDRELALRRAVSARFRYPALAYTDRMDRSKLVLVQAFGSPGEADLAKSMLESAGIDAMIQADTAGGMRPHIAWSGLGFRVLVREEDAAEARGVLKPPDQGPPADLVAVQSFPTLDHAELARDELASAGVAAEIQDLTRSGSRFQLLVREEDVATAREVLPPSRKAAT